MRILFCILFLVQGLSIFGQNFHTSFSDYYFMRPDDFAVIDDGYVIAVNYGFTYDENEFSLLLKTDIKGNKISELDFSNKKMGLYGIKPLNDSTLIIFGGLHDSDKDYPIIYLALISHELNIVKELEFEATKIAYNMQQVRVALNNSGNIICCISNDNYSDLTREGGYMLALSPELELINSNFFSLNSIGLSLVDDIMPFKNSDTSLVIIEERKAYLVDGVANIIDSVDNFLYYEEPDSNGNVGYLVSRTFAAATIDNHIYVGGRGLAGGMIAVVKFDRNMNRLKTRFFNDSEDDIHTGYTNTMSANDKYLYTVTLSAWNPYSIYYTTDNYMTVRKIDTALNLVWEKRYKYDGWGFFPFSIRATPDGGFGLVATRNHYESMGDRVEAYFIKADSLGNFDTTLVGIKEMPSDIRVYPNPGTSQLNISYSGKVNGAVFSLYSLSGTKVLSQAIEMEQNTFTTGHLPSGMYVYELRKNGEVLQRGKWIKQ